MDTTFATTIENLHNGFAMLTKEQLRGQIEYFIAVFRSGQRIFELVIFSIFTLWKGSSPF